jgi:hypothetical protein
MVLRLNQDLLPDHYRAIPQVHFGSRVEVDVATIQLREEGQTTGNGVTTAVWAPPRAKLTVPVDFADQDHFEVQVRDQSRNRLVAAVELISPANKDRPGHRRDFAIKCAGYLQNQVSLILVDVVTERQESMHGELMRLLHQPDALVEVVGSLLYSVAYRTKEREDRHFLELWPEALSVGAALPTLPLWIGDDRAVPLDLEATYLATCEALRIE